MSKSDSSNGPRPSNPWYATNVRGATQVEHPQMEIAWLMHCPQLTGQAVTKYDGPCLHLSAG